MPPPTNPGVYCAGGAAARRAARTWTRRGGFARRRGHRGRRRADRRRRRVRTARACWSRAARWGLPGADRCAAAASGGCCAASSWGRRRGRRGRGHRRAARRQAEFGLGFPAARVIVPRSVGLRGVVEFAAVGRRFAGVEGQHRRHQHHRTEHGEKFHAATPTESPPLVNRPRTIVRENLSFCQPAPIMHGFPAVPGATAGLTFSDEKLLQIPVRLVPRPGAVLDPRDPGGHRAFRGLRQTRLQAGTQDRERLLPGHRPVGQPHRRAGRPSTTPRRSPACSAATRPRRSPCARCSLPSTTRPTTSASAAFSCTARSSRRTTARGSPRSRKCARR